MKRAAASLAGDAYQGALEAVMAVLVGAGAGYWADGHWGTAPYGVLAGVVIGFAAMVLRLLRMRQELPSEGEAGEDVAGAASAVGRRGLHGASASGADRRDADERGPAEEPAQSGVWRDDATDE